MKKETHSDISVYLPASYLHADVKEKMHLTIQKDEKTLLSGNLR